MAKIPDVLEYVEHQILQNNNLRENESQIRRPNLVMPLEYIEKTMKFAFPFKEITLSEMI